MWLETAARIAGNKTVKKLEELPEKAQSFLAELAGAAGALVGIDVNVKPYPENLSTAYEKKKVSNAPVVAPGRKVRPTL